MRRDPVRALLSCRVVVADDADGVGQNAMDLLVYAVVARLAEENPLLADNNLTSRTGRRQMVCASVRRRIAIPWEERNVHSPPMWPNNE